MFQHKKVYYTILNGIFKTKLRKARSMPNIKTAETFGQFTLEYINI